jgi:LuxR family transcriptional regulator, quorum-sensing system regulator BjaR1
MLEQRAFDAIELLRNVQSIANLTNIFDVVSRSFGATSFIICDIPPDAPAGGQEIHASGWNAEWQSRYLAQKYSTFDPVPNFVNRTVDPFHWKDAWQKSPIDVRATKVMNEACHDFRMKDGYCVPIHGLTDIAGLVSVATDETNWALSDREDAALHMISIYAYEAVRKLHSAPKSSGGGPKLSQREIECVQWLAEGKTSWEIGVILSISELTVTQYVKNASQKLGTRTRPHLVARAHRLNIIK